MRPTLPTFNDIQQSVILSRIKQSFIQDIPLSLRQQKPTIWIACSGGRDSMTLLYACFHLNLSISVIHINHQLQEVLNDDWQIFVEDFCKSKAIPCISISLNWDKNLKNANEQQARQARYQAILSVIETNAILALAHHANDQVETLLMNICQGTGITGLTGMKTWSQQQEFGKPIWLWRPLLSISRQQITDFVEKFQVPFVDDPTNIGCKNHRAFLRERIFPVLEQRFNGMIQNVQRTMQNMTEVQQILQETIQQDLNLCQVSSGWTLHQQCLDIQRLQQLSNPRRLQLLHQWIKGEQKFAPSRKTIEQVNQLILQDNLDQQTIIQWQGLHIRRYRQILYRLDNIYVNLLQSLQNFSKELMAFSFRNNKQLFGNFDVNLQLIITHIPSINIQDDYYLRSVLPAEKFCLLGKSHHETFKKLCQRLDIPSWERGFSWVVCSREQEPVALILSQRAFWLTAMPIAQDISCPLRLQIVDI